METSSIFNITASLLWKDNTNGKCMCVDRNLKNINTANESRMEIMLLVTYLLFTSFEHSKMEKNVTLLFCYKLHVKLTGSFMLSMEEWAAAKNSF